MLATGPRCSGGATARVPSQFIGLPSSATFFPVFFSPSVGDVGRAEVLLHEVAHLQAFAARDVIGTTRYYGCPVRPEDATGPGSVDPDVIRRVADARVLRRHATRNLSRRQACHPRGEPPE